MRAAALIAAIELVCNACRQSCKNSVDEARRRELNSRGCGVLRRRRRTIYVAENRISASQEESHHPASDRASDRRASVRDAKTTVRVRGALRGESGLRLTGVVLDAISQRQMCSVPGPVGL